MECDGCAAPCRGEPLPLPSLRLLVPPLHLVMASMWQVVKKQDVLKYWTVAEYVSLVVDVVPDLLVHKHRLQLLLGLRARYILELCRNDHLMDRDLILSHLEKLKRCPLALVDVKDVVLNFPDLIHILLKDPDSRRDFFTEVFPVEYGTQYDNDLQTLFSEFVFRLNQLLPVPDMEQTVSWLGSEHSLLKDCERSVSEPTDLITLLHHHKDLGHFEQHVPPSSMGEGILSTLSAAPSSRLRPSDPPTESAEAHVVSFVDDVAVEIITVTDYSEVELSTSTDKEEVVRVEDVYRGGDGGSVAEEAAEVLPDEAARDGGGEAAQSVMVILPEGSQKAPEPPGVPPGGPHDCPDCKKKFKFASSLTAHRVIHTGERPHCCSECGRCFSFRQSLDRHRHTHTLKAGCRYRCVCGDTFQALAAFSEHKRKHGDDGDHGSKEVGILEKKIHDEEEEEEEEEAGAGRPSAPPPCDERLGEPGAAAEPLGGENGEGEPQKAECLTSEREGAAAGRSEEATPANVRTSGRKRKPTMKMLNLVKGSQRWKKSRSGRAEPTQSASNCTEHSYGSSTASTQADEGSSEAVSCPKCSFQIPEDDEDKLPSGAEEDKLSPEDGKGLSCPDCQKSFRFQSLLQAHRRVHTGERPFLCPQCGCSFSFEPSLDRHALAHAAGRSHACLICGESLPSPAALKEHRSTHVENGEYLCSECGRAFAWKSALVRHAKTHGKAAAGAGGSCSKCPHCELVFSSAGYLNKHLPTHTERTHACSCGKSFSYRGALAAHQRTHQKDRPHVCAQCGKGFLYRGGLLSHMKIHSEDFPFKCSHCGKSFKRERNMKKHERCHTGEDVFCCSQCDKSFVYKATLVRHELTHSGERPFLCSDCGKGFFSHAELLKHERFHTGHKPFQCPHCGKRFTQSCYLTVHLRYHTGVRPYSCAQCDKRFLSANRLKRHQRIHTGEKPYVCGECGKGFRQSYNLKMHQRTHVMKLA